MSPIKNINFQVVRVRVIQIILLIVCVVSYDKVDRFGTDYHSDSGEAVQVAERQIRESDDDDGFGGRRFGRRGYRTEPVFEERNPTYVAGFNGGAVGMSIICSVSLLSAVSLEIVILLKMRLLQ
jgi:hypothetical protein